MIAILITLAELLLSCHCASWRQMPGGYSRCAVVRHRCELADGVHLLQLDVNVCTRRCP